MEPERPSAKRSALRMIAVLGAVVFLALLGLVALQVARLSRELDHEREELKVLRSLLNRREREPVAAVEKPPSPPPADPVAPPAPAPRTVEVRVSPDPAPDRIGLGIGELRAGRYARAHVHFVRAVPDSYVHLTVSSLALGFFDDALYYLGEAMRWDRDWLGRLRPADLFGSPGEYSRVLQALEAKVAEDPLDAGSKTLLAFLYYYEKGPEHARALLVEAAAADPDRVETKDFLQALEP